jgi:hypothetical protein
MPSSRDAKDRLMGAGSRFGSAADVSIANAEARYHRERLALYRARVHSGKPTSVGRLQELERNAARADAWARRVEGR